MAIRTFNSVGGFSVGDIPDTIISSTGNITGYTASFRGNVSVSNGTASWGVLTDKLYYSNGSPWVFVTAGGSDTQIQFNDGGSNLAGSSNFTWNKNTNLLTVLGNANIGNLSLTGTLTSGGNITAPYFFGNVVGNISGNIIIPGTSTGVVINDGGNANSFAGFTYTKANNYVYIQGNLTAANISTAGNVAATNLTGTLTTASQTNITSVGTLTTLAVSGTANVGNLTTPGNLTVSGQVISNLIPSNDNTYTLGNTSYQWKNVYVSGNLFFSGGSAYMYSVGSLIYIDSLRATNDISGGSITSRGDASVAGNVQIGGNLIVGGTTTYINVTTLSINDPVISLGGGANNANASTYDGFDRGLFLRNYKSDFSNPVNEFIGWKTANGQFEIASNAFISGGANVVTIQEFGNLKGNVFFGNLTGTVLTASQPQITSLGTLSTLTVSNWANIGGQANVNTLKASGLNYPTTDGSAGQFLQTYGNSTLTWATVSTSSISNGTSNVSVVQDANVNISSAGVANVLVVTSTGANITGTLNVTGTSQFGSSTAGVIQIGNSAIRYAQAQTTSATPNQSLLTISGTVFTVIEFFIKAVDSTGGKYSVATISAVRDASSIDYAVYGTVNLPASSSTGTYSLTYSGGVATLQVSPSSASTTNYSIQYRTM